MKKAEEEGIGGSHLADSKRDMNRIKADLKELEKALQIQPAGLVSGQDVLRQEDVSALSRQIKQVEAKLAELEASAAPFPSAGGGEAEEQGKRLPAASGAVLRLQKVAAMLESAETALEASVTFYKEHVERVGKGLPKEGEMADAALLQTLQAEVECRRRLSARAIQVFRSTNHSRRDVRNLENRQ
ncbi:hypothetical protein TGDOM2_357900 [Toxoplasma gondii GAB2-2007-GAL-DOM2]|uniref:Uncharacterized protein n=1 Tax=Toxoplasma gondii GAB2-2007-GAL-DOM2 TaxID=1130820 RepID=A0A086JDX2_TOXGO|nr:hypothetical protein TGDOM2_357900 [Toxoplasma gondii GAB2-2007-GAL-DOM2]